MSSINTSYGSYPGLSLSYYLNQDSNSGNTGIGGNGGAASSDPLLNPGNSSSSSDDLYAALEDNTGTRSYNLPTDSNGKAYVPTIDQMNNASTPDSKLTVANYVAQAVLMQADASTKTDNASRATDIVGQAQSVLNALSSATSALTGGDSSSGSTSGLSAAQQTTVSTALNAINTALAEVKNLLPKTSSDTQASVNDTLTSLDSLAGGIAAQTGVSWTSVTGNGSNTVTGYSAESSTSPAYNATGNLLSILA